MRQFLFAMCAFLSVGMQNSLAAAPQAPLVDRIISFRAEESSAEYFKKAHSALVYDPTKIIVEDGVTRFQHGDPKLFWDALWWAFLSGIFLMLTSLGLFVLVFVLGLLHQFRFKSLFSGLKLGGFFVGGFTACYALLQYFTFQIMQQLDSLLVYLFFSFAVILLVGWCSLLLLGVFYDHTHPQHFRAEAPAARDYAWLAFLGVVAAWFMLSQKNSLLLSFARQSILSELSGSGVALSVCVALGAGCMAMLYWMICAYFLKEDQISLWFSDVVSLFAWAAIYLLVEVISPLVFVWHAVFLSIVVLVFAGSYLWNSARSEMAYHYFNEYSKDLETGSVNHMIAGFRGFNLRVMCKRFCAVVAFILIVPAVVKLYLYYHRLSVRQAVIQAIKSM